MKAIGVFYNVGNSNIFIHCVPSAIDESKIKTLSQYNVTIILNVFDANSGKEQMNEHLPNATSLIEEYGLNYQFNLILTESNYNSFQLNMNKLDTYNATQIHCAELININNSHSFIVSSPTGQDRLEDIDYSQYYYRGRFNACLNRKLAICSNGDIQPCPFINDKLGNLHEEGGIYEVVKHNLHKRYWQRNKSKVSVCSECENRFACVDCTNLELKIEDNKQLRGLMCSYDPVKSSWKDEEERSDFNWGL